jgi:hypothetical protein
MNQEIYEKEKTLFELSKKDVKLFGEMAIQRGYDIFAPTDKEDSTEFWDIGIVKNNKEARTQIKGYTDAHKHGYVWVELKSVKKDRLGRNIAGWLYGKATVLGLLIDNCFAIYDMRKLRKHVEELVDFNAPILVTKIMIDKDSVDYEKMKYRQYDRRGDIMVAVPLEDIENFKIDNWK